MSDLPGFTVSDFSAEGFTKPVYRRGEGPAVVIIHELPGMTVECVELAARLADEGYRVHMPLLFGEPLQNYGATPLLWGCVRREFNLLSARGKSPITDYLRALARAASKESGGKGVGAIGMCLTGSFALSMMLDQELMAPVVSQPSMPPLPWQKREIGVTDEELACAKRRVKEEGARILGFKFTGDRLSPPQRFERMKEEFGDAFTPVVVEGNKHSVLTMHFKSMSPEDRARVWGALTGFLRERLK